MQLWTDPIAIPHSWFSFVCWRRPPGAVICNRLGGIRRPVILRLVTVALLVASSAHADPRAIDARVRAYVDAGLFSGVVLVSRGDRVVFEKAYGLADRGFGVPNTTTTKFHIASLSKPITAAAVLLLADRGMLALADPVSRFVPGFPRGDQITVEQLLTHYSGWPTRARPPRTASGRGSPRRRRRWSTSSPPCRRAASRARRTSTRTRTTTCSRW